LVERQARIAAQQSLGTHALERLAAARSSAVTSLVVLQAEADAYA
jgi:hypothetical protein